MRRSCSRIAADVRRATERAASLVQAAHAKELAAHAKELQQNCG